MEPIAEDSIDLPNRSRDGARKHNFNLGKHEWMRPVFLNRTPEFTKYWRYIGIVS